MKGYKGKILRVNLSSLDFKTEEPEEGFYKLYLGGRGFIVYTLLREVPQGADPLGPENKLVFALGPMTGHPFPGSGRNSVGAKSPLTGAFGESEAGGYWGAELRRAGYDAIILEGKAEEPVYLWIKDGQAEIRPGRNLWGLEVAETEETIRNELKEERVRIAAIGPAGENLVRYASIAHDVNHVAGRAGMGAVMGSKKLKAIAVRGDSLPEVAHKEKLQELARWMGLNYKRRTNFWQYGTGALMDYYESSGNLPICNFRGGKFPQVENIMSQSMYKKGYVTKMESCFGCPVRCKKVVKISQPWEVNPIYGGPEYETLAALGSNCGVDQVEAIIKANELCGRYGLDTISTGVAISFAMECFEEGILTVKDTDGLPLTFGNAEGMIEMVKRIALRQGLGDLLAEGTKRAAQKIGKGAEDLAMQVKGEEIPMHEPRYKQGMGLHYSVHATGADHCTGIHDDVVNKKLTEWERVGHAESVPVSELSARKARMLYQVGLWRHVPNYLGLCLFVPWENEHIVEGVRAVTGWPMSTYKIMKTAERGITLARIFNLREGFSCRDDILPRRFASSSPDSNLKGIGVDPEKLAAAQKIYYQMLGWDESGVPTIGRLVELNIEWAAQYLVKDR